MANTVKILIETLYKGQGAKQAANELKNLESVSQRVSAKSLSLSDNISVLGTMFGTLAAGVTVAGIAINKALEFGGEGAGITRLENSFQSLATVAGESGDEILAALDKAASGTVSNSDLILSANRAMMLGLGADSEKLAQLLEVAAFRGRAMGLSTTQAFNDIVTGVGRASPMILDNLGIVIDAKKTYEEYANSIGKSSGELTKAEKTQALLSRTIEEGNKQIEAAGGLVDDTASSYERLNAQLKNATDELKKQAGEALLPLVDAWNKSLQAQERANQLVKEGVPPQVALSVALSETADATEKTANATENATGGLDDYRRANIEAFQAARDFTPAIEDNTDALKEQSDTYKTILSNMFRIQDESERFVKGEEDRARKLNELEQEKVRLSIEAGNKRAEGLLDIEKENQYALKQIELDQKINDLAKESEQALIDKEKASKELIFRQLEQKAAQDNLINTDEIRFLQDTAVSMGLVDRASADMAIAASEAADIMWEQFQKPGEAVGDIKSALDAVVNGSPYVAQVQIETVGSVPNLSSSRLSGATTTKLSTSFLAGRGSREGGATLGRYADGGSFIVPGQGTGDRPYRIDLTPGERVNISPPGSSGGGDKTINVYVDKIMDKEYIKLLAQEIGREMVQ